MFKIPCTFLPFLYPCLRQTPAIIQKQLSRAPVSRPAARSLATEAVRGNEDDNAILPDFSHLDPSPADYGRTIFADKASLEISAGSGGHGCVSFLREKFVSDGPPNGGNGGTGGSVYIQAIRGETSLHKLARRRFVKAGRGKNGQGGNKGGKKGDDVLIQVPVGTVVREVSRNDPVADEETRQLLIEGGQDEESDETRGTWRRDKWILYPATKISDYANMNFPPLPKARRSSVASAQADAPVYVDLSEPMEQPILLAAGAVGGYGNPHFFSRYMPRPKMATKGESGMTIAMELELKLLADLGFVGQPNAGKSTLLRALSRSRARVGDWAFTTLHPNIGTMVLDDNHSKPHLQATRPTGEPRTHVSVADIPGLIEGAHLDKGLGLGFLRHIERAQVLAFVIDLSNGDPVVSLETLWRELGEFERLKDKETNARTESRLVDWTPDKMTSSIDDSGLINGHGSARKLAPLPMAPLSCKPWFVVASKADVDGTQQNFAKLQAYLDALSRGAVGHPSGNKNAWIGPMTAIPVSAIRGEGVERIPEWTVKLLRD